jgi:chemotaxis protein methyltransferase CheR
MRLVAARRLAARLEVLGLRDYAAYTRFLQLDPGGPAELQAAVELLVPHETYFFREPNQLACFEAEVLPLLEARSARDRSLRLWSAGCATGEEPYTLAMVLAGRPALAGWATAVLGTDLSASALGAAQRGEYGPGSLRATSEAQRARWFDALADGRVRVKAAVRERVRFDQVNLLDGEAVARLPRVDVIFCRNVLMYFDEATRVQVVEHLFERLEAGGFLLLGHAEQLLTLPTRLEALQLEGDLVYRRPGG